MACRFAFRVTYRTRDRFAIFTFFVRFLTYRRDWETATLYGKKDEAVIGISFHFVYHDFEEHMCFQYNVWTV